jgi:glycosyltransferase involved in cell wall biosynthesis
VKQLLVVSPSAKPGGAERALASLVRHLPTRGFRPVVVLLEPGPLEAWLGAAGCEVVLGPDPTPADAVGWVRGIALARRAEVVLSSKWQGHLVGGPAAEAAGLPSFWWQQDLARKNPGEERAARLPAAAIVCSSDHAVAAQRVLAPDARVVKIHPGVAVTAIAGRRGAGSRIRAALGWEPSRIVGIVGRLERWKGQEIFLRAAALVAGRHPDVRFAVIGGALLGNEGSYPDDLEQLAAELGLADRVCFAGHQMDVYPWFDALDVAVHASRGEPFGLVVVEAMALGKPLVATVPGGPAEIVEDGVSGLLVPFGTPDALAEAVNRILDDRALGAALGREASRRAPLFSEERMADCFASLLSDLLGRRA